MILAVTTPGQTIPDDPAPIIAPEGAWIVAWFVALAALLAAAAFYFAGPWGAAVAVPVGLLALWAAWFFRDPARAIPAGPGLIISPADGVVCGVGPAAPPPELGIADEVGRGMTRVSVFMNVFNVHVNRAPEAGRVVRQVYTPGRFFNAALDKASDLNERCAYALALPDGRPLVFVQIAGLIARRIVPYIQEGAVLRRGQRFGLIRFGSRVDVYLPPGVGAAVKVGDRSVAGETVLAALPATPETLPGSLLEPAGATHDLTGPMEGRTPAED